MTVALRLFVAIDPPPAAADSLYRALGRVADLPRHRETPRAQLHLTLQFIGDTDPRELGAVEESVRRAASGIGPMSLTPWRLITLPDRGRSRLVAAETDAPPAMVELQRRLAHRLARDARPREREAFRPHLTMCRFTGTGSDWRLDRPIVVEPFAVTEIRLVRSVLRPGGADHADVAVIPVERAGSPGSPPGAG